MRGIIIDQVGGEEMYHYDNELCLGLNKKKIDITLITTDKKEIKVNGKYTQLQLFKNTYGQRSILLKGINYFRAYFKVLRAVKEIKPDFIHLQWALFSPIDIFFILLFKSMKVNIYFTAHDILPFNKRFYDSFCFNNIYKKVDLIFAHANSIKEGILDSFSVKNPENIVVIPHGNYLKENKVLPSKSYSRTYLNIDENDKVILFFGQIKKVKGLQDLIKALPLILEKVPNAKLIIAGKMWYESFDSYQSLINKYSLEEKIIKHVRFISDDEVDFFFQSSDIVALPYREVYQSGVLHLAFSQNKPVVATEVGGIPEVVDDGINGMLVPAFDYEKLAKCISTLLMDENLAQKIGENGYKKVKEQFSWDTITEKMIQKYKVAKLNE